MNIAIIFVAASLTFCQAASAGPIANLFRDGIFQQKWGADLETIRAAFPGGKTIEKPMLIYWANDDRKVLNIERKKQRFAFRFDASGAMCGVAVEFPSSTNTWAELVQQADQAFGQPLTSKDQQPNNQYGGVAIVGQRWAADDGFVLTLTATIPLMGKRTMTLDIDHCGAVQTDKSKLGF